MSTSHQPAALPGAPQIVEGRSCEGCTLCCKLIAVREFDKPRGVWCTHCDIGRGCKIHGTHPDNCRSFLCSYLLNPALDERWKPAKSKLVLLQSDMLGAPRLVVHVDTARPDAWREQPFYGYLKSWVKATAPAKGQVLVWIGPKTIVVLPDRDRDLGEVKPDQVIVTWEEKGPFGSTLDVSVVHKDDPRLANAAHGAAPPGQAFG